MKLLLILMVFFSTLFANNLSNFKLKTEKNRALILKQYTPNEFAMFLGNPWFEDEKFAKELLRKSMHIACYIKNEKVLNDKNNFINMHVSVYGCTGEEIRVNKDILLGFSKKDFSDYQPFQYAALSLKKDKVFVNILLDRGENVYPYIDESIKDDETIIKKSMKLSVLNYERLPKKYRKDKQMTMQAVKKYGYLLEYADESLKDDMEVIEEGLKDIAYGYPSVIEYASKRIRDNKQLMLRVLKNNTSIIKYVSPRLKKDKDIITLITSKYTQNFKFADSTLKKDENYIKMLIKKDGNVLKYADKLLQSKPNLVKMALDNRLNNIAFASEEIQKNRTFALKALANSRYSIRSVHKSFYEDPIYMYEAIKRDPYNIKYVQNKLKDDIDLAVRAMEQDIQVYLYLSKNMQKNSRIKAYLPENEKPKFSLIKPPLQQTKGAIRGVTISFLVVSEDSRLQYHLVSPPKGMKIVQKIVGESCTTPSLGKGNSGVEVEWSVPMDAIEGKTYDITLRGIDKKGNISDITFPIKVPKTKPIQTKLVNNELIVTDKSSNLYGMKMKGHSGEYISKMRLRSVAYENVWRKYIKNKQPEDVVEYIVFVLDDMPNFLDVKMPEYMDTYSERINIGMHSYKYKRTVFESNLWERATRQGYLYDNTNGYVYLHKNNNSEIFFIILEKAQNKGAL